MIGNIKMPLEGLKTGFETRLFPNKLRPFRLVLKATHLTLSIINVTLEDLHRKTYIDTSRKCYLKQLKTERILGCDVRAFATMMSHHDVELTTDKIYANPVRTTTLA